MVGTTELHEELIDAALDRYESIAAEMKVGTGDSVPSQTNTALDNSTHTETVIDGARTTTSKSLHCFIDGTENNGNAQKEIGIFTEDGTMLGRSLLTPLKKTADVESYYTGKLTTTAQNTT